MVLSRLIARHHVSLFLRGWVFIHLLEAKDGLGLLWNRTGRPRSLLRTLRYWGCVVLVRWGRSWLNLLLLLFHVDEEGVILLKPRGEGEYKLIVIEVGVVDIIGDFCL